MIPKDVKEVSDSPILLQIPVISSRSQSRALPIRRASHKSQSRAIAIGLRIANRQSRCDIGESQRFDAHVDASHEKVRHICSRLLKDASSGSGR